MPRGATKTTPAPTMLMLNSVHLLGPTLPAPTREAVLTLALTPITLTLILTLTLHPSPSPSPPPSQVSWRLLGGAHHQQAHLDPSNPQQAAAWKGALSYLEKRVQTSVEQVIN